MRAQPYTVLLINVPRTSLLLIGDRERTCVTYCDGSKSYLVYVANGTN